MTHRIRKQRWVVKTGSPEQAFAIRRLLNERWEDTFLPAFDRAFEEGKVRDAVVRIPRLELSVKVDSIDQLTTVLPGLIFDLVRRALGNMRPGHEQFESQIAITPRGARLSQVRLDEKSVIVSEIEDRLEAFLYYLRTGDVPWHLRPTDPAKLIPQLMEAARVRRNEAASRFRIAAEGDLPAILFRWFQLTPYQEWPVIAELLTAEEPARRSVAVETIRTIAASATAAAGEHYAWIRLAVAVVLESRRSQESIAHPDAVPVVKEFAATQRYALLLEAIMLSYPEFRAAINPAIKPAPEYKTRAEVPSAAARPERPLSEADAETPSSEFTAVVSYAGLILVHPFLGRFFENLKIKSPNEPRLFPSEIPRAAAALHFLATGRDEPYEFELGMIKILLGLRLESPVSVAEGLLSADDREECEALLKAVIEHWNALKNTSTEGLRASFLDRRGFVLEDEQGWHVQVEPRSFDLLLNRLPWGITTVWLPWITKPILTDWRTP
jgi:hypothetical protein